MHRVWLLVEVVEVGDTPAASGSRKPGPWAGELVAQALDHQHRGDFHSREAALRWIADEIPRQT